MWADVETGRDFVNFNVMASLVSQMVLDAKGEALSIGISGGWGVGKSSMVKLIEADLRTRIADAQKIAGNSPSEQRSLLFVNFNAWLYQGHDDAKAALMEEIAQALMRRAKEKETSVEKGIKLLKRIDVFRGVRLIGELALTAYSGLPVGAIARAGKGVYDSFTDGEVTGDDIEGASNAVREQSGNAKGLLKAEEKQTPPQMIHAIRKQFEELLDDLKLTLVVFVDDLDRCLPPTVIGTLEAMRLFLFMRGTAFIIAADDKMIKEAVRVHFPGTKVDDDIVISYFDKLIQVPLRVPPLGTNEVKAYLMMLFVQSSGVSDADKETVRLRVIEQLASSWQGNAIDAEFVQKLIPNCPAPLAAELELADRLARQMIISPKVNGNPRLIKRFMNTLSIRRSLAKVQKIAVNDAMFAKLMLFERFASATSFNALAELISTAPNGKSETLRKLEHDVRAGKDIDDQTWPTGWKEDEKLIRDWLKLPPDIGDVDLRGALHVGRESAPILSAENKLSKAATELLSQLVTLKVSATVAIKQAFNTVTPEERSVIMTTLLDKASSESEWGTPAILYALEATADADTAQAERLIVFLVERPASGYKPAIVPRLKVREWGKRAVVLLGKRSDLPAPFTKALNQALKEGK
ncbi:KAP family P-loop domain protein [Rhizobium sp. NXC24]|uniref:KAP family NTPase n=1 Tax=Rhizobium sp. NXC24 TaxID=2048897 RepID=UPI000CDF558C|nr:KAP family P-loop domain protein [Rhizobium sp. NXC24]AVA23693.1 KAP P-loop domain-containing protein [Rhizobium sp. NXC24]